METADDNLKLQFQRLQEQQQKKLLRRKQRKEEREKEKSTLSNVALSKAFGVEDNLELKVTDPAVSNSFVSEELVEHLNEQIRVFKDENSRLYKLLSEKDFEIRHLKKKKEEEKSSTVMAVTNETAASKIVELSKKVRELTSELEAEKRKSKQFGKQCHDLQQQISSMPEETRSMLSSAITRSSMMEEKTEDQVDVKSLQDKLKHTESKMAEFRNQCATLKQDLKVVHKVLSQEVGETVNIQTLLSGNSNWRGRAQQVLGLQQKVEELKSKIDTLENPEGSDGNLDGAATRRKQTENKQRELTRKMEKERKEAQEQTTATLKALEGDHESLKQKMDAAKARNKVLSNELKATKAQLQTLLQKGQHDDELIDAMMKQQTQLRKMVEETTKAQQVGLKEKEEKMNELASKTQQDTNVVEQLKTIVSERESKVKILENEIQQLKLAHLQRAQIQSVSGLFTPTGARPPSTSNSRPTTAGNDEVDLEFHLQSVSPPQSRMSESTSTYRVNDRPLTANNALDSSRVSSRKSFIGPGAISNNIDKQTISELHYQCQELKILNQAIQVERDKLMELVKVTQGRLDGSNEKLAECQNELIQQRRKNAHLEKQVGKAKLDQTQQSRTGPTPRRKTTGKMSAGVPSISASSTSLQTDAVADDGNKENVNLDELISKLEIQRDENEALKAALQSTLKAKEEDLKMYTEMMEETKKIFLQALRQAKQSAS